MYNDRGLSQILKEWQTNTLLQFMRAIRERSRKTQKKVEAEKCKNDEEQNKDKRVNKKWK